MKWIWIILGFIMLAAGVLFWMDARPTVPPSRTDQADMSAERAPVRPSARATPTTTDADRPAVALTSPAASKPTDDDESLARAPVGRTTTSAKPAPEAAAAPGTDRPLPKIEHATVVPSVIDRQEDGSIIADKRFRITGAGTAAEPYRVSWECLASAQESYVPRLSETKMPERIAMLDGKVVRIDGYVTFPLLMKESSELILMLNQWDGCCIGVPPTPYDAVEVKLAEPAKNTQRHAGFSYGSVTGTFKVEPFLVDNWLVGLYLMENARYDADGL